jgi:serine/threonine protein kinase
MPRLQLSAAGEMHIEPELHDADAGSSPQTAGTPARAISMEPGRLIAGKFRLTRQLGQGGMGSVWGAVHQTLGREVAVKFLHAQTDHVSSLAERFVSEARMAASIKHRFVVDVFDFGVTEEGVPYMVLELLHGKSLAGRMDHGPSFPVRQAVQLMADCLRGLQVVHDAGIIHRDLKPDNIFVIEDADGVFPKLIDFGISKRTESVLPPPGSPEARQSRLTQPGTVMGTPYYMSPEQLRGRQNLDRRSDVYSFGVMLYELLVGRLPFDADNIGDLMVAITVSGAPPLSAARPELGAELAAVVKRALSPAPEERFQSALSLRDALLAALPGLPPNARTMVQMQSTIQLTDLPSSQLAMATNPFLESIPAPPPRRIRLTRQRLVTTALIGALVLLGGVCWSWLSASPEAANAPFQVEPAPREQTEAKRAAPAEPIVPLPTGASTPSAAGALPPTAAVGEAHFTRPFEPEAPLAKAPRRARPIAAAPRPRPGVPATTERTQKLYRKLDF